MQRRNVLVLAGLGTVGLAGCLGSGNGNDDDGTSEDSSLDKDGNDDDGTSEDSTSDNGDTSAEDNDTHDELGDPISPDTLALHEQALRDAGSFTVEMDFTQEVFENPEAYESSEDADPWSVSPITLDIEYVYDTDVGTYWQVNHAEDTSSGVYRTPDTAFKYMPGGFIEENSGEDIPVEHAENLELSAEFFEFDELTDEYIEDGTATHNGESVMVYVANGHPDYAELESTAYVNEEDVVTYVDVTNGYESDGFYWTTTGTIEVTNVGTTTVSSPDWYDEWAAE